MTLGDHVNRVPSQDQHDCLQNVFHEVATVGFKSLMEKLTEPPSPPPPVLHFPWSCTRCRFSPQGKGFWIEPVRWAGRTFCWSCTRQCPNCNVRVPLGATMPWESTYLCKICYVHVTRKGYPPAVTTESQSDPATNNDRANEVRRFARVEWSVVEGALESMARAKPEPVLGKRKKPFNPDNNNN